MSLVMNLACAQWVWAEKNEYGLDIVPIREVYVDKLLPFYSRT